MRRTLLIIAAVLVLIGVGVGMYFLFFNARPTLTADSGTVLPGSGDAPAPVGDTTTATQGLGEAVKGAGTELAPRFIRITDGPVALGSLALFVPGVRAPKATSTPRGAEATIAYTIDPEVKVEYIERESGNIYAYTGRARTLTRLTNKTLPGVVEASWLGDGSVAYARFSTEAGNEEHVATYALPVNGTDGFFLEQDLSQATVVGSTTLLTLLSTTNGSIATLSSSVGTNVRTLFNSLLGSLTLRAGGGVYTATTKASSAADGYAFVVDPKSGAFTRALGPFLGLTTLISPSGKLLLYSYLDRGKITLSVMDLASHTATRLPLGSFTEKCTWAPDSASVYCAVPTSVTGNQPDAWYQGVTVFSDRLWKIDLAGRVATQIIDPKQAAGVSIDVVSLAVDRTADFLIFSDKHSGALYAYDL